MPRIGIAVATLIAWNTAVPLVSAEPAPVTPVITQKASAAKNVQRTRLKIGLALGGGGARGAAEVGVLKVLVEEKIPIDVIAGTSIGSVVGGLYDAGLTPDEIAQRFRDSSLMKAFMPMPIILRIALAPLIFTPRLFGYHPYDGLYKGHKAREFVEALLPDPSLNIEKLRVPYAAICTNLVTGKSLRITTGHLATAMQASTAVPGIKKPVEINNQLFCDGGVACNLPVKHVREMGADFVIAVDINEELKDVPLDTFRKAGSVTKQTLKIQLSNADEAARDSADVVIHPATEGIGLISKSEKDGHRGIEAGMKAARAALPEIRRKLMQMESQTATTGSKPAI